IGNAGDLATVAAGKATWASIAALGILVKTLADAKGDLLVATAADTIARKAAAANGALLTTDSSQADGLLWTPAGANGSILRILAGMPTYLAPGAEAQVLGI